MRKLLILRPEPGASASAERARALGLEVLICPLFAVQSIAWTAPDPARFDALLLTSANALRHAGPGLRALAVLPVVAVGEATADAARAAGFAVSHVGDAGVDALLRTLPGRQHLLHLAGEDHWTVETAHHVEHQPVYRAAMIDDPRLPDLSDLVVAVHSPRAGARLGQLAGDRSATVIAAISDAAAAACGPGWQMVEHAKRPDDMALLALAARLCQSRLA